MKTADGQNNSSSDSEDISPWQITLAIVLAPFTSAVLVIFATEVIDLISQEQWANVPIIWPPLLYIGGIVGGTIGGFVALMELRSVQYKNSALRPTKLFSPDIFYLGLLITLTFMLEMLSESELLQGLLFILEVLFFIVIGRNISRKSLEISSTSEETDIQKTKT
ncbi:MAG: hypothetical protein ACFE98_12530 [Candidatus Hermodarchaeota archaeon]